MNPAQVAQMLGVAESDVLASLEAGDLKGKKIGTQWRVPNATVDAFLERRERRRARCERSRTRERAAEVRLPGLRRRSGLESGQGEARLPVLRHRIAGEARRRTARSSSTISSRRCAAFPTTRAAGRRTSARCAARAATRSPCSTRAAGAELPVLRLGAARCRTRRRSRRSGPRACCRSASPNGSARDGIRAWYGELWLAPSALKRRALTDTVEGVYLPYWTFDAQVEADWTAEAGHYYYTTETYVENGQTRTRQVQQHPLGAGGGHVAHFFDDDLVCASVGVQAGADARHRAVSDARAEAVRRRRTSPAGSSSATRSTSSARRNARARRWTRSCRRSARSRFRATRIATSPCTPTTRSRRSSTSSRRSGC